jgi:uncharacterized protein (TIGR02118 family)
MATLAVTYPRHEGCRFDAGYYVASHIPLVEQTWSGAGMTGAELLWPEGEGQPYALVALLRFSSQGAIDAALASPGTGAVMADVAQFTDIQPVVYRAA